MAWTTPKTDWVNSDKFAIADFNRIKNNLDYLNDVANELYPSKAMTFDFGEDAIYISDYYPSRFNLFEEVLESFETRSGMDINIGTSCVFRGNEAFIDFKELNRIESCTLRWKSALVAISSVTISPDKLDLNTGATKQLTLTVIPSEAEYTVAWSSSDTNVATVSNSGLVTAVNGGSFVITATISQTGQSPITATVNGSVSIGSAGTVFYYNGTYNYYDFITIGKNADGNGKTTLVARYVYGGFDGCLGEHNPVDASYLTSIGQYIARNFSSSLQGIMQEATKKEITDKYNGTLTDATRKYFVLSGEELNAPLKAGYTYIPASMGSNAYSYFTSNSRRYGEKLDGDEWVKGRVMIRQKVKHSQGSSILYAIGNYEESSSQVDGGGTLDYADLRPIIFLNNTQKVKQISSGVYEIDWTNSSSTTLGSLPVGSIVRDVSGTRNVTVINATSINAVASSTMPINTLQIISVEVAPSNATHKIDWGYKQTGLIGTTEKFTTHIDVTATEACEMTLTVFVDAQSVTKTFKFM